MNRPTGVTVLAVLLYIGAGLLVLGAIGTFVGGAFVGSMIGSSSKQAGGGATGAGLGAAIGAVVGVFLLVGAVLNATCGYGLWSLKEWGRMLTIVLTAIGLVMAVFSLFVSMIHFHIFGLFFLMVRIAIGGLIIWYLSQPQVKAAFGTSVAYQPR
jgi:Predicted membrane protein (DUF2127)